MAGIKCNNKRRVKKMLINKNKRLPGPPGFPVQILEERAVNRVAIRALQYGYTWDFSNQVLHEIRQLREELARCKAS